MSTADITLLIAAIVCIPLFLIDGWRSESHGRYKCVQCGKIIEVSKCRFAFSLILRAVIGLLYGLSIFFLSIYAYGFIGGIGDDLLIEGAHNLRIFCPLFIAACLLFGEVRRVFHALCRVASPVKDKCPKCSCRACIIKDSESSD